MSGQIYACRPSMGNVLMTRQIGYAREDGCRAYVSVSGSTFGTLGRGAERSADR